MAQRPNLKPNQLVARGVLILLVCAVLVWMWLPGIKGAFALIARGQWYWIPISALIGVLLTWATWPKKKTSECPPIPSTPPRSPRDWKAHGPDSHGPSGGKLIVESDDWSKAGVDISSPDVLAKIQAALEHGPVILEHWFYYGSRSPDRIIFEDYEEFLSYLKSHARPGDKFFAWSWPGLCRDDNALVSGKYPDEKGRTPRRGAY